MKRIALILTLLTQTATFGQVNLSSSLTACYALDASAAEPINNLTGTLSVVTPTVNRFNTANTAYYFNGTNSSYIQLPNSPLLKPNEITFSAWVKADVLNSTMDIVFAKNIFSSFFSAYSLGVLNTGPSYKFTLYRQNGSGDNFINSTTSVSVNTWYHIAFSLNSTVMKMYVNGVLEASIVPTITSFNYDPTRYVILGGTNESFNNPWNGTIDNARFYNRILSVSEISAIYTQDPSCNPAPVASFSFSPPSLCAGGALALSDLSTNSPNAWNWQIQGAANFSASTSNPTLSLSTAGNYTISLVSSNTVGASNTATQTITVLPNPTVIISSSGIVCIGQNATLTASGATTYSWNTGQTGSSLIIGPSINSSYNVVGTGANGCQTTTQMNMTIVPLPSISITGISAICPGEFATLNASGTAQTYTWSNGATGNQLSIGPLVPTTYTVTGTNANGCTNTATHSVSIYALPTIFISGSGTVCQGSPTTLLASGSAITFVWSNATTGNLVTVTPLASTIYTVIGTDANGCTNTATQLVFVNTLPAVMINVNNTSVCLGDAVILSGSGAVSYLWTGGVSDNIAFYPSTTNNYVVTGTGANGCKNTASVQIVVNPKPMLITSSSTSVTICPGEPVTLSVSGANIYSWSTGDVTPMVTVNPTITSSYTVTGTDANGCKAVFVFVQNVNACTGIQDANLEANLRIYPNPFNTELIVSNTNTGEIGIEVYNVLGEKILDKISLSPTTSLTLYNEPNGIYFIKIFSGTKMVKLEKIIKTN